MVRLYICTRIGKVGVRTVCAELLYNLDIENGTPLNTHADLFFFFHFIVWS